MEYNPNMSEEEFEAYKAEAIGAVIRGEKHELAFLALLIDLDTGRMPDEMYKKDVKDFEKGFL